ncbi:unnamed protein product [Heterobilharzia americana]|nr:unnamed protein product [Heterobilharzia americana]
MPSDSQRKVLQRLWSEDRSKIRLSTITHDLPDCGRLDWIMQQTVRSCEKKGIRWTVGKNLEDLDFADDLCLMSHKLEDLQVKTNKLTGEARQRRQDFLQVNVEKTGDEDTQPTTAGTDHHQREEPRGSSLFHLPKRHRFNYRQ